MPDPTLDALVAKIDGRRMWRDLEVFERHRKEAGSPGERESLAHVDKEMQAAGWHTRLLLHDAFISLPGAARAVVEGVEIAAITQSFSRPSPQQGLRAPLVDLGDGSAAAFASADVRGRIVLIDGIANAVFAQRAAAAGAIGQLHISPNEHLYNMCVSPVWGSPSDETLAQLPRAVMLTIARADGERIRAALAARPRLEVTLHAEVDTGWRETPILEASLPGPRGGTDEPFVLFSGHHDAWFQGTMDNGGANATMIEVARLLAARRGEWRRGLRVLFWSGHSQGRYSSSAWYADAHWQELERRAVAHVNVDSTGGRGNTDVSRCGSSAELFVLAGEAIRAQAGQTLQRRRMNRAGDQSFWGIGVPSMFTNMGEHPPDPSIAASASLFGQERRLAHGTGWWWHNEHDRLDRMDEAILVRDTRIYLHVLWRLVSDSVLPLDYALHARDLQEELRALLQAAGGRFDLGPLIERAATLESLAERFAALTLGIDDPARAAQADATLMALSRALVPHDYTSGDRFEPDPAVPQPPLPGLQRIRRFAGLGDDRDALRFLEVGAVRARNHSAVALGAALAVLRKGIAELGGEHADGA
jgi:N-acetylated-alpha-linked acidic dipeptidase